MLTVLLANDEIWAIPANTTAAELMEVLPAPIMEVI